MHSGRTLGRAICRLSVGLAGLVAGASLAAQPQGRDAVRQVVGTAGLAGVVIGAGQAASPIRSGIVTLTEVAGGIPSRTTETDASGRFAFTDLPAGRYDVSAIKPAYLKASYGAVRPMRPGTPISLTAGQQVTAVALKMWRGGVITGVLLDEKNRPLSSVTVSARRLQGVNGTRTIAPTMTGSATTDNRGIYRIFGMPPGDYAVLSTIAGPGRSGPNQPTPAHQVTPDEVQRALRGDARSGGARGPAPPTPPTAPAVGYAPVYYPGTTVAVDAVPVHVEAGEERSGIDFAAQLVPLAEVKGTIAPPDGQTMAGFQLSVALIARSQPSGLTLSRPVPISADGSFTIGAVTPGRYTVMARATQQGLSRPVGWWASTPVLIDGQNVSGVYLTLEPGATVTGRVVFDGTSPPSMAAVGVSVRLTPVGEIQSLDNVRLTSALPDGTFTITGVVPDDYLVSATLIPRSAPVTGWIFKSASVGGRDLAEVPLTISTGTTADAIVVSFTDRMTEISGVVQDAVGRPVSDCFIVAFPAKRASWPDDTRRVQVVRPATDGTYLITGLPVGDYELVVTTDVGPDDLQDSMALEKWLAGTPVRVSVKDGAKVTQNILVR